MQIKRKNGLKVVVIVAALLLCLALAIGITGAWYQAKRQATGTLNMDQGIIIDYQGFGKETDGVWTRENSEITYKLFSDSNALPGENIAVNTSGIRANAESVDFYARVKLSYKFYNGETLVTLANPSDLITTSAQFFGENWVDSGKNDGYFYYATGSTLNKFSKDSTTFISVFAENAKFIIEGENFTGATDGEGGGFVVDSTTTIDKIEVYLTLETLQGDADAKAEGWGIAKMVDFSKVDEGKIVTSVNEATVSDVQLNVTIDDTTTALEEVTFPYGAETVLEFDSPNVEYVQLKYTDGTTSEKFYDSQQTGNSKISVLADENKETGGYVVGWFSMKEYTGFAFSTKDWTYSPESWSWDAFDDAPDLTDGSLSVLKYFGSEENVEVPASKRVRLRDVEIEYVVSEANSGFGFVYELIFLIRDMYPVTIVATDNSETVVNNVNEFMEWASSAPSGEIDQPLCTLKGKLYVETSDLNIIYEKKTISQLGYFAFGGTPGVAKMKSLTIPGSVSMPIYEHDPGYTYYTFLGLADWEASQTFNTTLETITIGEGCTVISEQAFQYCKALTTVNLPNTLKEIKFQAFRHCSALENITIPNSVTNIAKAAFSNCSSLTTITIPDSVTNIGEYSFRECSNLTTTIGEGWVKVYDESAVDPSTLLKDINYAIKRA